MLTGRFLRVRRLSRKQVGRYLFVPLDHSFSDGPIARGTCYPRLIEQLSSGGADAVIVHKGRARLLPADALKSCNLIIHMSGSTAHSPEVDSKVVVADVEECIRLGADAVSVHFNLGAPNERDQLRSISAIARECDRFGIPLLAMVYARGPKIQDGLSGRLISHAATVAVDLGADIIKVPMPAIAQELSGIAMDCPMPVVVAGGAASDCDPADDARLALESGCAGVAFGRRLFGSPNPLDETRAVSAIVHGAASGDLAGAA